MSVFRGKPAVGFLLLPVVLFFTACGQRPAAPEAPAIEEAPSGPPEPGQIELSDPQVTFVEPNQVRFEVRYKFTKGKPSKYYLCEISFPGTPNHGAKPMEKWELKAEGVIKDGVVLSKPPVQTFEIRVSEADSPQNGYKPNSNTVSGTVK
jgi:hypothetical protein